MQHYIDAFQTRVLYSVYQVGSKFTCTRVTLAMARIEVTFKNGASEMLTVAATSGRNGDDLLDAFAQHLPDDVFHLKTMVTDRLLPNGEIATRGHAEESIINWFYDAKDRLLNNKDVPLERGIFNDEGVKIGIEKYVLDHEKVAGIRVKELAASRAICNRVCTQKVIDLDADMFKELSQADSTGVAEGAEKIQKMESAAEGAEKIQKMESAAERAEKIQKMEKAAEEVSQRKVAKIEKTGPKQRYVQEGINGLKAVHTPTPFEKLVNPKLK